MKLFIKEVFEFLLVIKDYVGASELYNEFYSSHLHEFDEVTEKHKVKYNIETKTFEKIKED